MRDSVLLHIRWSALFILGSVCSLGVSAQEDGMEPRVLPSKAELAQQVPGIVTERIAIKFLEGSGIRVQEGRLSAASGSDLNTVTDLLQGLGVPPTALRRLYDRPIEQLDAERELGSHRANRQLADLTLYFILDVPRGRDAEELLQQLSNSPALEFAEPMLPPAPPPIDISPPTPNFQAYQGYKNAPPQGIGAFNPSSTPGGDGKGTKFVDIEYSWRLDHEDLELSAAANIDSATAVDPFSDAEHGTAVLGEIRGRQNAYGVSGITPGTTALVAPANTSEFAYNVARAINVATGRLAAGDVILLEQQNVVCGSSTQYGPVEWSQTIFDAIAQATSLGIIIVEAAGNGSVNLDSASCLGRFDRTARDSWAIIVGAGSSSSRSRLSFSSFGSRVDVQGWGHNVTTTGYGDAFNPGDARQLYTYAFSGTSSASPIVAASVLALQGALKARGLRVATPVEMREALVVTGSPQGGTDQIGPLPNLDAALAWLVSRIGGGPSWRPFESFGGSLGSSPECLNTGASQTDCWARLSSGALGWWRYNHSSVPALVSLGGQVLSPPSCLNAGGKLHCFVQLNSNQLGQITRTGSTWGAWQNLGDSIRRRPACSSPDGTKIVCLATNASNKLRTRTWSGTSWGTWSTVASTLTAGNAPNCYTRASLIECVVVNTTGRLQFLRRNKSGTWAAPQDLGGSVNGRASCIAPSATTQTCFMRGSDSTLRRINYNGTSWSAWENLGGAIASEPSCTNTGGQPNCFAVAANGTLVQKRKAPAAWEPWVNLGGSLVVSRPSCVAPTPTGIRLDCFARGTTSALLHSANF